MKFKLIPIVLMILSQGCASRVSKESAAASSFMGNFAKEQKRENGLYGIGRPTPAGKIKKLTLYFMAKRQLNVEEARILYINVTQQMLNQVNADAELRLCLDHYPFTIEDLQVSLTFRDPSGRDVDPPYIAFVFFQNGFIHYAFYDALNDLLCKEDITEPYAEALRIVQNKGFCNSGINLSCKQ